MDGTKCTLFVWIKKVFPCTKNYADLFVQIFPVSRLLDRPMYGGAIYVRLESSFRDREVIPGQMVFPYPFTVEGASALFLFNQRLR